MTRTAKLARLAIALALAGCATAIPAGTETVDGRYVTGGGEWNTGGGISAVARLAERDGATLVCGAWTTDRQSTLSIEYNRWVMEAASVRHGKTVLVQNIAFMRHVPDAASLAGETANCVATEVAWRPEFGATPPDFAFPRMAFLDDVDPLDAGGGNRVVFRQTLRPDMAR